MERSPLATLLELGRQARQAESSAELQFLLVNDSHGLAPTDRPRCGSTTACGRCPA